MCKLKLKTFMSYSFSRKCSLTTELNTEECINMCTLPTEEFHFISFLFLPSTSLSVLGTQSGCKLSWLLCSFSSHNTAKGLVILSIKVYVDAVLSQIGHVHSLVKYCIIVWSFNDRWQAYTVVCDDSTSEERMPNYRWKAGLLISIQCRRFIGKLHFKRGFTQCAQLQT